MTPASQHTKSHPVETLDKYITKSHYDRAIDRAPPGKAPGPDAMTNELVKHLSEEAHTLIYPLFQLMAIISTRHENGARAQPAYYTNQTRRTHTT